MSGMSVTIRHATAADADDLGRVHADAWLAAYGDLFAPGFLQEAAERRRRAWRGHFANPSVLGPLLLVAVEPVDDTDRPVAFLNAGPSHQLPGMQEVLAFYAHPDAWGTGAAAALMRHGLAHVAESGDREAVLWTLAGAGRARRFYEKNGWHLDDGHRTRDFGDGRELPMVEYRHWLTPG
jgi:GNAT superfamily N-acetyltransferase